MGIPKGPQLDTKYQRTLDLGEDEIPIALDLGESLLRSGSGSHFPKTGSHFPKT